MVTMISVGLIIFLMFTCGCVMLILNDEGWEQHRNSSLREPVPKRKLHQPPRQHPIPISEMPPMGCGLGIVIILIVGFLLSAFGIGRE